MFKRLFTSLRYRRLLFNITISLCALVIIPILFVGLFLNWHSQRVMQEEIDKSALQILDQTRRLMDYQLSNIDSTSIRLANNTSLMSAIEMTDLDTMEPLLLETQYYLRDFYINSPYIDSIYIYYENINMIQSAITGLHPIEDFEQKELISNYKQMDNEKKWVFSAVAMDNPTNESQIKDESSKVTLIRPIPLLKSNNGAIIVNLNKNVLFKSPSVRLMRDGEEVWMLHPDGEYGFNIKNGEPLSTNELQVVANQLHDDIGNFTNQFNEREYSLSSLTSPHTGWKYIYLVPTEVLYSYTKVNNWFLLILLSISIIISTIIAVMLGNRIYRPIQSLVQLIGAKKNLSQSKLKSSGNKEFPFIEEAIEEFTVREKKLEEELERNIPILRQSFISNLLHEHTNNHEDRLHKLRSYGIPFSASGYFVCILRIDNYRAFIDTYKEVDQNIYRYFIEKVGEEMISEQYNVVTINTDSSDIVLLCNSRKEQPINQIQNKALTYLKAVSKQIQNELDLSITIGIGNYVKPIGKIATSYQSALKALELRAYKGNGSIVPSWEIELNKSVDSTIFEKRMYIENSIIAALKAANFNEVIEKLNEFINFIKRFESYPFVLIQHTTLELIVAIIYKTSEIGLNKEDKFVHLYKKIMEFETLSQLEDWLINYMTEFTNELKKELVHESPNISQQILDYINENYTQEISLSGIANKLSLDHSYVSRLFKQNTGISFIEYLISLRLSKAKELLINSSLSVKEIGKSVGYNNTHSFIRIFKKNEGVTPGKYRQLKDPKVLDVKKIY